MSIKKVALVVITIALLQVAAGDGNVDTVIGAAKACYAGFVANIPASLCYKAQNETGVNSTCNNGTYLALTASMCEGCFGTNVSYSNHSCLMSCYPYAEVNSTHCLNYKGDPVKKVVFPPLFSYMRNATYSHCQPGYYADSNYMASKCYKDCNSIGFSYNCDGNICSQGADTCDNLYASGMWQTALPPFNQVTYLDPEATGMSDKSTQWGLSLPFGFYSPKAMFAKVRYFTKYIGNVGATAYINNMTNYAIQNLGKFTSNSFSDSTIANVCNQIGSNLISQAQSAKAATLNFQSFNASSTSDCDDVSTPDNEWTCAQSVLSNITLVDPSGIIAFGSFSTCPSFSY